MYIIILSFIFLFYCIVPVVDKYSARSKPMSAHNTHYTCDVRRKQNYSLLFISYK